MDSNDRERFDLAREELFRITETDEMRGVPVVVFANKQDLPSKSYSILVPHSLETVISACYLSIKFVNQIDTNFEKSL